MTSLLLHIGAEKTGSTAIQRMLWENRKELKRQGFQLGTTSRNEGNPELLDLLSPGQRKEPVAGMASSTTIRGHFRELKALAERGNRTLLLSSEKLFSRLTEGARITHFFSFLKEDFEDIRIVLYLRPQGSALASLYSTALRNGCSLSFEDWSAAYWDSPGHNFFDYAARLAPWELGLGHENFKLFTYERSLFPAADVRRHFIEQVLLLPSDGFTLRGKSSNTALTDSKAKMQREVNRLFFSDRSSGLKQVFWKIARWSVGVSNRTHGIPSDQAHEFLRTFAESNSRLCESWDLDRRHWIL